MTTGASGLIDSLEPASIFLGFAVCFAGGLLGGLSGYGTGLLVSLFLMPVVGAAALVPVTSVLMLINNGSRVWFNWQAIDLRLVRTISVAAIPTSLIGAALYVRLESVAIQLILGIGMIALVPLRRWLETRHLHPGPLGIAAVGGAFGFLSSVIVGAGMLILPLLLGLGLTGPALVATDAAIAVIAAIARIAVFGSQQVLSMELFLLAVTMGLCTIPGTACASWLMRRTSARVHTLLIEALIVAGGASLVAGTFAKA